MSRGNTDLTDLFDIEIHEFSWGSVIIHVVGAEYFRSSWGCFKVDANPSFYNPGLIPDEWQSSVERENQKFIWQAVARNRVLATGGPKWNNDNGHRAWLSRFRLCDHNQRAIRFKSPVSIQPCKKGHSRAFPLRFNRRRKVTTVGRRPFAVGRGKDRKRARPRDITVGPWTPLGSIPVRTSIGAPP